MSRLTKIIATLGPASVPVIEEISVYTNAFRFNFSHGNHEKHAEMLDVAYEVANERNIALIADLSGPEIRTTNKKPVEIVAGEEYSLSKDIGISFDLKPYLGTGDIVLIDEGRIKFRVREGDTVVAENSGTITPKRHVNVPQKSIPLPSLTPKDIEDLEFIAKHDFDMVAQSFVKSAYDVQLLRKELQKRGSDARIIAKIESYEALRNLEDIIQEADAVMVARGDLGVEVLVEEVPLIQKRAIKIAREYAKPVIVATHMLKSMVNSPIPTRAEANDVANAVLDGADAVMLSEETSVGKYPLEAVRYMDRIIRVAERERIPADIEPRDFKDRIALSAIQLAEASGSELIAPTMWGTTPRKLSRYRIRKEINVFTPNRKTAKFLSIVYGVKAFVMDYRPVFEKLDEMKRIAGIEKAVFVFGYPEGNWNTNTILYY